MIANDHLRSACHSGIGERSATLGRTPGHVGWELLAPASAALVQVQVEPSDTPDPLLPL